jgi:hypothetical protein
MGFLLGYFFVYSDHLISVLEPIGLVNGISKGEAGKESNQVASQNVSFSIIFIISYKASQWESFFSHFLTGL